MLKIPTDPGDRQAVVLLLQLDSLGRNYLLGLGADRLDPLLSGGALFGAMSCFLWFAGLDLICARRNTSSASCSFALSSAIVASPRRVCWPHQRFALSARIRRGPDLFAIDVVGSAPPAADEERELGRPVAMSSGGS